MSTHAPPWSCESVRRREGVAVAQQFSEKVRGFRLRHDRRCSILDDTSHESTQNPPRRILIEHYPPRSPWPAVDVGHPNAPPGCLEWLKNKSSEWPATRSHPNRSPASEPSGRSPVPGRRSLDSLGTGNGRAIEHLEYAVFRRYHNQLTLAQRGLDNSIRNARSRLIATSSNT